MVETDVTQIDDDVCIEIQDDVLVIERADSDEVVGEVYVLVLTDPVFSDGPYVYGEIQQTGEDAFIQWDMMRKLFRNDIIRASNDDDNGFTIEEIIRMDEHDYDVGGAVTFGIETLITPNDIQVMLESDDDQNVEENPVVTQDGEVIDS